MRRFVSRICLLLTDNIYTIHNELLSLSYFSISSGEYKWANCQGIKYDSLKFLTPISDKNPERIEILLKGFNHFSYFLRNS